MSNEITADELFDFYSSALGRLPEKFTEFLKSNATFFDSLRTAVENDDMYFVNRYQSMVRESSDDTMDSLVTLGELMSSAPLQMQHGLDGGRIAKIWTDSNIGLSVIGTLLNPPEVARYYDGRLMLVGANHRIGAIVVTMVYAGIDAEALFNMKVRVREYVIDDNAVARIAGTNDANVIQETHDALVHALWVGSNSSRTVSAAELKDAESFKVGVDRYDSDSVVSATFTAKPRIDVSTAFRYLVANNLNLSGDLEQVPDSELSMSQLAVYLPCINGKVQLTVTTLDNICKSFFSELGKIHEVKTTVSRASGEPKETKVNYWKPDMKTEDGVLRIVDAITEGQNPLMAKAIQQVYDSLKEKDDAMAANVARQYSAIGKALAALFDKSYTPIDDPRTRTATVKKSASPKKSLGLTL